MSKLATNKKYLRAKQYNYAKFNIKHNNRVLQFKPKHNTVSDKDIISLLMGIVKLVRDSERNKILQELENQLK